MIDQTNYLDIPNLFINEIIGDPWLAFFIGAVIIIYLGMKYTIPFEAIVVLLLLYCVTFFIIDGHILMLLLFALAIVLIVYPKVAELLRKIGGG